jgi:protocatechuate 3,4-dioxygenase beta subunit
MLTHMGRHPYRPAHLHYIIEADGFQTLTTNTFDPNDPYINADAVFGVKESLIFSNPETYLILRGASTVLTSKALVPQTTV